LGAHLLSHGFVEYLGRRPQLVPMAINQRIRIRMAKFVHDRPDHAANELGPAFRIGLPNAQHAKEFFLPSRSPEVRAIAGAAIEHSGDHRESRVWLLTEEIPE